MKIIICKNKTPSLGKDDHTGNTGGDAPLYKQKTYAKVKIKIRQKAGETAVDHGGSLVDTSASSETDVTPLTGHPA